MHPSADGRIVQLFHCFIVIPNILRAPNNGTMKQGSNSSSYILPASLSTPPLNAIRYSDMILTLTGASGAGKTTIAERLIATLPDAHFLTSYTTRAVRPSDLPGEYVYLSDDTFDAMETRGDFLWTARVADTRHGTTKSSLQMALDDNASISIMILVPEVMTKLYEFADALGRRASVRSILVCTPSEQLLRARMRDRGDEDAKIDARIAATLDYEANACATGIGFIEITNEGDVDEAVRAIADAINT